MANEKVISGDAGILFIFEGGAWLPVGCLTSFSLNTTVSEKVRQTKCNPGVTDKGYGTFDYSVDLDGLYLNTAGTNPDTSLASHDLLLEKQRAKEKVQWRIDTDAAPMGEGEGKQYYGSAVITSLVLTQGSGDEDSSFTGTFSGDGDISDTDPTT